LLLVPLTIAEPGVYDKIGEGDTISVLGLPPVPDKLATHPTS